MHGIQFLLKDGQRYAFNIIVAAALSTSLVAPAMADVAAVGVAAKLDKPIEVTLSVHKLEIHQGKESLLSAESAVPGDVLEYHATYHNVSHKAVDGVFASLPIPKDADFVADSAMPRNVVARARGGKVFSVLPLQQEVNDANGKKKMVAVPLSKYGAVGWQLGTIQPGASADIRVRVLVPPLAGVAAVPASQTE